MLNQSLEMLVRRVVLGVFFLGLLILAWVVLGPFLVPVAWAGILAYVSWPGYHWLMTRLPGRPNVTAFLMTLLMTALLVLPMLWLLVVLEIELVGAYRAVTEQLARGPVQVPEVVRQLPGVGDWLHTYLQAVFADPAQIETQLRAWLGEGREAIFKLVGGVGRNALKFGLALLTLFFFYRDGVAVIGQARQVLFNFLGERVHAYIDAIGATTKAVVYGLVLTALAQGILAGLGYWGAGVEAPVALGAVTALIAFIPFGTPLVWVTISLWLLITGHTWEGIGLFLWGALVVSWVDNLIRPLVISGVTRIPFLLVMFGVLGGLTAFGLIGLFIGPVILAVLMAVWREWLEEQTEDQTA
ncbi:MAG: AI-2E family transporter [Hydrogenophilales bacterium]|nr:AI-2E family transporter [Hydrogenophilales bacterium]